MSKENSPHNIFINLERAKARAKEIDHSKKQDNIDKCRTKTRYSHFFKWFGAEKLSAMKSLEKYGIAAKYVDFENLECECYAPDPEFDDCCIKFNISEDEMELRLKKSKEMYNCLTQEEITLVDFIRMEIPDKLLHICNYFDIIDFLGLDEEIEAIPKEMIHLYAKTK